MKWIFFFKKNKGGETKAEKKKGEVEEEKEGETEY